MMRTTEKKIALEIRKILANLGVRIFERGEEIRCACPIHKSKNHTSMSINPRQNRWACWSRQCHEEHKEGLCGLIMAITGKTQKELDEYVDTLVSVDVLDLPEFEEFDTRQNKAIKISREEIKKRLVVPSGYYLNKGFSAEVLGEFLIGDCFSDKRMRNRAIFPIFDLDDNFIGCTGRSHSDKSYIPKWIHSKGLVTAATFYGIDKNKDVIRDSKSIILVEGAADMVKLYEYGIRTALSPFGCKLTARQAKLLKELGVTTIYLGLDNDEAGIKATKKITERYSDRFEIVDLGLRCDPDEMSKDEWDRILSTM